MNILFLGAGKRFTLLERVIDSGRKEQIGLQLILVEGQLVYSNREVGESYLLAAGRQCINLDLDASTKPDIVADFTCADELVVPKSIGTAILLNSLEHMPRVWETSRILQMILKPGGRAFMLTPWNLRFHGPRPDCWPISDDGYRALFPPPFVIESLEKIPCPDRLLSPIGITYVVRMPNKGSNAE
jgi:hypothetical protein